jgi:hypothetical protein
VRIARDYFDTKLSRISDGGFRVENSGWLRTVRFDHESRDVDLARSRGVIGFQHFQGNLYVFLTESHIRDVYLSDTKPDRPYVVSANFAVQDFVSAPGLISFKKSGWLGARLSVGGFRPNASCSLKAGTDEQTLKADEYGVVAYSSPKFEGVSGATEVVIRDEAL